MKLLATITAPGQYTLDCIPDKPIFCIHQFSGSYESDKSYLIGLTVNSSGTDYEVDNSATHYFGRDPRKTTNHFAAQSMIFVPSRDTIIFQFGSINPPSKNNRVLIFQ